MNIRYKFDAINSVHELFFEDKYTLGFWGIEDRWVSAIWPLGEDDKHCVPNTEPLSRFFEFDLNSGICVGVLHDTSNGKIFMDFVVKSTFEESNVQIEYGEERSYIRVAGTGNKQLQQLFELGMTIDRITRKLTIKGE